jgi:nicotinate phosphoribosyltransferase
MRFEKYSAKKLLKPMFRNGKPVGDDLSLNEIKAYREKEEASIWEEHLRLRNPQPYKVDLSDRLWQLREKMLHGEMNS